MLPEFRNEPLTDFSDPANARSMEEALARVGDQLGQTYPLIIGDKLKAAATTFASINPANPDQVVGHFQQGGVEDAERALRVAEEAFAAWSRTPAESRAFALVRTAAAIRRHKFDFAAWMVYEVSKSWVEADADVAELIDFAEYYARLALKLAGPQPVYPMPGEDNSLHYVPLGVGAVIPPWNFPSAITGGMVMAAVVSGNTVVLKPASTAPAIAWQVVRALIDEGGVPPGVVNYVSGPGSAIGDTLVDSPRTRFIAFTGSKEVGMRIFERAAKVQPGQHFLKRTILEMGGKDALVVDETADLDASADALVAGAFGFQGQKCSACSRAIVVDAVYDEVLARVVERTRKLTVGDPVQQTTFMGAVIDDKAFQKIQAYIRKGVEEGGRIAVGGEAEKGAGYFIQPTVIADVREDATVACEEIFGPVLAFIRARDFDHAVEIFNGTEFGLTGGLMSRRRDRLERARREFHVGNLYLNRKITGALVGVQPFGGFNMSGTDSKAGGPDYLLLFTQAKSICERFTVSTPARVSPL